MVSQTQNEYMPDLVYPPGETLQDVLDDRQMSQADLARRMGRSPKTINEIIQGKAPITPETALQLERVLDTPASFWNNLEHLYQDHLARQEEEKELANHVNWLKDFPINAMIKQGWIQKKTDKVQQLKEILSFFGITSPENWEVVFESQPAFRQTQAIATDKMAVAAWIRRGQLEAQNFYCEPYDKKLFLSVIKQIRGLTVETPEIFVSQLQQLCAATGVAVVFVPALPKTGISGCTYWMTSDKAVIQLSLRYKRNDQLWFSFFHEAGHIILHGKRQAFLEGTNNQDASFEKEADEFAAGILIPPTQYNTFIAATSRFSKTRIRQFANEIGIAPGIVVGRLQHDEHIPFTHCNDLKMWLKWAHEE